MEFGVNSFCKRVCISIDLLGLELGQFEWDAFLAELRLDLLG